MKQHLAAIAFTEKELEHYIAQLKTQGFETVSDVKKAEDNSYYQAVAKRVWKEQLQTPEVASHQAINEPALH